MADTQKAESFQASYKFPLLASLLSIVLGLIYLYTIRDVPQFKIPVIDEWSYDDKAQGILMGTWPSGKVFYQDPLYPYFLAFYLLAHRQRCCCGEGASSLSRRASCFPCV